MSFNWVDYVLFGILLISAIISFFRGFLREAISLITWLVGIIVALKYANPLQLHFQTWINSPTIRFALAFLLLFLLVLIVGIFINMLLHSVINRVGLKMFDRLLGVIFGVARGILIAALLLMFMGAGTEHSSAAVTQSIFAPRFNPIVSWLRYFLPDKMKIVSAWISQIESQVAAAPKTNLSE